MHLKNIYATRRPDFAALASTHPALASYVNVTSAAQPSLDFTNPAALRALTSALLKEDFDLDVDLRDDRLCPTIANRLDYLLTCLDLPTPHTELRALDIGTGHVAIYPLLLHRLRPDAAVFGSEIDEVSLTHARGALAKNGIPAVPTPASGAEGVNGRADGEPENEAVDETKGEDTKHEDKHVQHKASGGITLLPGTEQFLLSHPIYPLSFTLCNPPFFSSEHEALSSRASKPTGTSAPTCSANEEITRGGEVAFVSAMIDESTQHKTDCTWYTSLVGKYASLEQLVRKAKVATDNHAVIRLQQSTGGTVRWVLVWSFGKDRLSDEMTRPRHLDPSTSFARLLPLPNTFGVETALPLKEVWAKVNEVLEGVGLPLLPPLPLTAAPAPEMAAVAEADAESRAVAADEMKETTETNDTTHNDAANEANDATTTAVGDGEGDCAETTGQTATSSAANDPPAPPTTNPTPISTILAPTKSTWSRTARRAAARPDAPADADAETDAAAAADAADPLFRATIELAPSPSGSGTAVKLHWTWGSERAAVDGFWKFLVSKAGLRGVKRAAAETEEEEAAAGGEDGTMGREGKMATGQRGRGRGHGGGGGGRGGRSWGGGGDRERGGGRGRGHGHGRGGGGGRGRGGQRGGGGGGGGFARDAGWGPRAA